MTAVDSIAPLRKYGKYKFRLFGTHHLDRQEAVIKALDSYGDDLDKKMKLLQNQINLFNRFELTTEFDGIDKKWTTQEIQSNLPDRDALETSGFYRALKESLDNVKAEALLKASKAPEALDSPNSANSAASSP